MPRAFTDAEREIIRRRLLDAAREALPLTGVRKTSVGDLARAAGVSKGSFYLFFDSKEALFIEVLGEVEGEVRALFTERLARPAPSSRALVERYLGIVFETLETHPLLRVIADGDDMAVLFRAVPPEVLEANRQDDDRFFGGILAEWRARGALAPDADIEALAAFPRAALVLVQERALIGEDSYRRIRDLLVGALARDATRERTP